MRSSAFTLGCLLLIAGCDCGQRTTQRFPQIVIIDANNAERTSVDFGKVQLGATATQPVRVRNSGPADLVISKAEFSKGVFAASTTLPVTVGVSEEISLSLTFTPAAVDVRETGTVTLSTNDPQRQTVQLGVAGTGVAAVALVEPAILDFGEVYLTEKKSVTVSITNTGSNDLDIQDVKLTQAPATVTGDLAAIKKVLKAGESASTMLTFAPTTIETVGGSLEISFPAALGKKTITLKGQAIQAVPRVCFKFDDSPMEQCTDALNTFLSLTMGSLCDAHLYPPDGGAGCPGADGGLAGWTRKGKMYFRNEGNTPVTYSVRYDVQVGAKCDGGSSLDFEFGNTPDAGLATWNVGNTRLPNSVMDMKPWETAPVAITYRANSACREDAADQARVLWTRQGEPVGTNRPPSSLILNLTGNSLLPRGVGQDITMSGTVPLRGDFFGVGNAGEAPLRVTDVKLYQAEFLADGGRSTGPDLATGVCDQFASFDCRYFGWADGGVPNAVLPKTLGGTANVSVPVKELLGYVTFGAGASLPQMNREYTVFAVITTSDPYSPQVVAKIRATSR